MSFRPKPLLGQRINTAHPLAKGLVGCRVMNEKGGINLYDLITNSPATMNGSGWSWKVAENGLVMDFGAASINYALATNTGLFDKQMSNFSCAFTVKRADNVEYQRIFSKSGGATERLDFYTGRASNNHMVFDYYDSGGTYRADETTVDVFAYEPTNIVMTFNGVNTTFYIDGVKDSVASAGANIGATTGDLYIGVFNNGSTHPLRGELEYLFFWDKTLTDKEAFTINANPYAFIEDPYPIELFGYVAAGGYTLTAESGSYTKTGQDVGLLADRKLSVDSGSFAVTGIAAGLLRGYPLIADAGSFIITGQDNSLLKGSLISIDSGAFDITGQDAALLRGLKIGIESGIYNLTGSDVTLIYTPIGGYTLIAESGSYSLTGIAADLLKGYHLGVDSGSFILSGQDVSLLKDSILLADSGIYNITGQAADLIRTYLFNAESGSYSLSGQAAALLRGFVLGLEAGGYTLTGQDIAFIRNYIIVAQSGYYLLTGQDVDLIYSGIAVIREILELSSVINQVLSEKSIIETELSVDSLINQTLQMKSIVELIEE